MPSTTAYKQGDIVLVAFPFTDLTSLKKRPALIVSPDSWNGIGEDLVLAAITSQITGSPNSVALGAQDFTDGHLPKRSEVRFAKLFTIHSSLILRKLCSLTGDTRAAVLSSIRQFFA